MTKVALRYAPIALLLILWEFAARTGLVSNDVLPSFSSVLVRLWELCASGDMEIHVAASLLRVIAGVGRASSPEVCSASH